MRLALLTGGSKGLGLALNDILVARNYSIVEFSRTAPHRHSVGADLNDPANSIRAIRQGIAPYLEERLQELMVINNAGTVEPIGPVSSQAETSLLASLNINLNSPICAVAAIVGAFQACPCRKVIANVSSGAATKGIAGWAPYCAAKAGMENFFRALAAEQELQRYPFIAVNISPGVMDTKLQETIRRASPRDFPELPRFVKRHTEGGLRPPRVVAEAILRILALPSLAQGGRYEAAEYVSPPESPAG